MSDRPTIAVADGYATLLAHVLAHVPLDQPGNLYDPRYVAWSRAHLPAEVQTMLEHDAALLGRHWRANRALDVLHGAFALHDDLDSFRRTAARPLAQLSAHEVAAPRLLARLCEGPALPVLPIIELLHTSLALVDQPLARAMQRVTAPLERARTELERLSSRMVALLPEFASARIELVWALGRSGRALTRRILVGAPADWNGCSSARQLVLAAHEHTVRRSQTRDYVGQEWFALTKLARTLAHADDAELRAAHAAWLAELGLRALAASACERGWIDADTSARLGSQPLARAELLAAIEEHADVR